MLLKYDIYDCLKKKSMDAVAIHMLSSHEVSDNNREEDNE